MKHEIGATEKAAKMFYRTNNKVDAPHVYRVATIRRFMNGQKEENSVQVYYLACEVAMTTQDIENFWKKRSPGTTITGVEECA